MALTAHFIGGQSLLIHCAEVWLEQGHSIASVISDEKRVHEWAAAHHIPAFKRDWEQLIDQLQQQGLASVDYLFSVVNLKPTPQAVLDLATHWPINFHDGPLPKYAGLNVTNWALLNGEREHGITWHLMEAALDKGAVLHQELFPITEDETAFTLNAKCFQAGLSSFTRLAEQLSTRSIEPIPQSGAIEHFCYARQRPVANGVIDWQQPAADIERLSRALNFGHYPNPITTLKAHYRGHWFQVGVVQLLSEEELANESVWVEQSRRLTPGTLVKVESGRLVVTAGEGLVQLSEVVRLTPQESEALPISFTPLTAFDQVEAEQGETIKGLAEEFARSEAYWQRALRAVEPIELPFQRSKSVEQARQQTIVPEQDRAAGSLPNGTGNASDHQRFVVVSDLRVSDSSVLTQGASQASVNDSAGRCAEQALALALLWFARLAQQSHYTVALESSSLASFTSSRASSTSTLSTSSLPTPPLSKECAALFSNYLPLTVKFDPKLTVYDAIHQIRESLQTTRQKGSYAIDLIPRLVTVGHTDQVASTGAAQWQNGEYGIVVGLLETAEQAESLQAGVLQAGPLEGGAGSNIADRAPLKLYFTPEGKLYWVARTDRYDDASLDRLKSLFEHFYHAALSRLSNTLIGDLDLLTAQDRLWLTSWNQTAHAYPSSETIVEQFERQVAETPDREALIFRQKPLTFLQLNQKANQLARLLCEQGIKTNDRVGIALHRSHEMVIAMLATLKVGAAYVPLDPTYPEDRTRYMIEDAALAVVLSTSTLKRQVLKQLSNQDTKQASTDASTNPLWVDLDREEIQSHLSVLATENLSDQERVAALTSEKLAYMIYTSGSTGRPKGVMVAHRNVMNFFTAMDQHLLPSLHEDSPNDASMSDEQIQLGALLNQHKTQGNDQQQKIWLAVTSISFDISVLELFWTLTRGVTVLLYRDPLQSLKKPSLIADQQKAGNQQSASPQQQSQRPESMQFGLFFWNHISEENQQDKKYDLLFKATEMADQHGFSSVSTPERHFGSFGGDYPNPSVISAALAVRTQQIQIRAGSCVLPLHHPVRVVEEWSVVDNLSNGRVAISFASGWQPNDFLIMPQNHANAKQVMLDNIQVVQDLWQGKPVSFEGPNGPVEPVTQPRPVQPSLPSWLTTAGNPESFKMAGERGLHLLTHLLGQSIESVAENIALYRQAWKAAGHPGSGHVTLMLHTLVGQEGLETEAEERRIQDLARQPMKSYLKSAVFLVKAAAWHFPTFANLSKASGSSIDQLFDSMDEQTFDDLLEFAFLRYYQESGLFGTFSRCVKRVDQLKAIGVDEIGCLIDYGLADKQVMAHMPNLCRLLQAANPQSVNPQSTYPQSTYPQAVNQNDDFTNDEPTNEATNGETSDATIAELCVTYPVTHLQCTPSQASMLTADDAHRAALGQLQTLLLGGEALPLPLAKRLRKQVPGQILNVYGPTETTIWSSCYPLPAKDQPIEQVVIGKPLANTQLMIADEQGQPLPVGVVGELYIGGEGVVPGYFQRPELNQERFIDPSFGLFSTEQRAGTWYKTGDLARWIASGELEYVGRSDFQVKLRGYRIELGEIETCLAQHEQVVQAVVTVIDPDSNPTLVAFLTMHSKAPSGEQTAISNNAISNNAISSNAISSKAIESDLRAALLEQLPDFMVPGRFVVLERMPMTPNGKIDRKPLPTLLKQQDAAQQERERAAQSSGQSIASQGGGHVGAAEGSDGSAAAGTGHHEPVSVTSANEMEQRVLSIWQSALGREVSSLNDNFFDVGGHSLLALKVLADLRSITEKPVQITDIFRYTTIRTLAAYLSADTSVKEGETASGEALLDKSQQRAQARKAAMSRRRRRR